MEKYLGSDIKQLGFGLMRLPMIGEEVDIEQTNKMVDLFMKNGFTYFDTAYVYINGKSECAAKTCLVDRYPRESFQLATKMPLWDLKGEEELDKIFQEQLDRTGAGYFDFYLLHNLTSQSIDKVEEIDAFGWAMKKKAEGKIRHLGFSCHDKPDFIDRVLTKHPEAEFVQLQINYADWENENVQSRGCYEMVRKHGKSVIVMEPVKGGSLAVMADSVREVLTAADPKASPASWAIRYAASLDGLVTVLSGMSTMAQMEDNVSYMADFKPLSSDEQAVIAKAVERLNAIPQIACTACKYCVDGCPQKINIPGIFSAYNGFKLFNNEAGFKNRYKNTTKDGGVAGDCIQCGQCEGKCPQHLPIIEHLAEIAKVAE